MKITIKKSSLKKILLLIILFFIYILVSAFSYSNAVCSNIANNVFRLHVIANSDSESDQNLKYIVRDEILQYINSVSQDAKSKEEIIEIVKNNINNIENIAQQTINNYEFDYVVNVDIGNFSFPTKKYGDITLPPGYYDALRIEIGEAKGQNWWCVMFPPLCFVDVTSGIVPDESKEIMKDNLSEEEYTLISENTNGVQIKFKLIEVLQNLSISGIFM